MPDQVIQDEITRQFGLTPSLVLHDDAGKVPVQAYYEAALPDALKQFFIRRGYRYWRSDPTPHNPAEEGFVDASSSIAFIFPLEFNGRIRLMP